VLFPHHAPIFQCFYPELMLPSLLPVYIKCHFTLICWCCFQCYYPELKFLLSLHKNAVHRAISPSRAVCSRYEY
jgi:hypothetical protein